MATQMTIEEQIERSKKLTILHEFARQMIGKHVILESWKTKERFDWSDEIAELLDGEEKTEEKEELSACCGAPFYSDSDICTECKEHG
jgi:hypothetical protein